MFDISVTMSHLEKQPEKILGKTIVAKIKVHLKSYVRYNLTESVTYMNLRTVYPKKKSEAVAQTRVLKSHKK